MKNLAALLSGDGGVKMDETIIKLLLAIGVGVLIGLEREYHEKAAGLRVIPLVCVGATLFTLYGGVSGNKFVNPQVAAGVVTGIGFLGAGVILRERGQVTGMTTATTIWTSAALGMGIGLGYYLLVGVAAAVVLLILWAFPRFDIRYRANDSFAYEVIALYDESRYKRFMQYFEENDLKIDKHSLAKKGTDMVCFWRSVGKPEGHERLMHAFMNDPEVKEFTIT
jgi:putative Mg2+ transporter-C (MgtC) family protein